MHLEFTLQFLLCFLGPVPPLEAGIASSGGDNLDYLSRDGELNRCGPLALQVCATFCGLASSREEIDKLIPRDGEMCNLLDIKRAAVQIGLHPLAVRWSRDLPQMISAPAIIPIEKRTGHPHFVALVGRKDEQVCIIDVPYRPYWIDIERLKSELKWRGDALHVAADATALGQLQKDISRSRPMRTWLMVGSAFASFLLISLGLQRILLRRSHFPGQPNLSP